MVTRTYDIDIENYTRSNISLARLRRSAEIALKEVGIPSGSYVSIAVIGSSRMRALNKQWRKEDRATTVLSFSFCGSAHTTERNAYAGEVLLCPAEIARIAKTQKTGFAAALEQMLVHGIVHVAGYTHARKKEFAAMNRVEREILGKLHL